MKNKRVNNAPIQKEYNGKDKENNHKKWSHPAFCASMELELREDRDSLIFEDEYNLNTKPNEIDLMIIKANNDTKVKSSLGAIFRKHNIFEFKNFRDSLDRRAYHRTMGYVHLYIAYADEDVFLEDITVSFVREGFPRKLMSYFKSNGFEISDYENGIYHIKKSGHVDMQIIVTGRLGNSYVWINKITNKLKPQDVFQMEDEYAKLDNEIDLVNAESVMDMSISLNKDKEFVKEMIGMGALRDLLREKAIEELKDKSSDLRREILKDELNDKPSDLWREIVKEELKDKSSDLRREIVKEELKDKSSDLWREIVKEELKDKSSDLRREIVKDELNNKSSDLLKEIAKEEVDKKTNDLNKQLKDKDEQLKTEQKEIIKLRKEIEELKKLAGNKIAML
ncbi:MAG: hypothetical protein IJ661_01815 [Lachnospiraceae bacterium]|nr:hypothetical protein [Lachnospiraceae bacterium]